MAVTGVQLGLELLPQRVPSTDPVSRKAVIWVSCHTLTTETPGSGFLSWEVLVDIGCSSSRAGTGPAWEVEREQETLRLAAMPHKSPLQLKQKRLSSRLGGAVLVGHKTWVPSDTAKESWCCRASLWDSRGLCFTSSALAGNSVS